MVHLLCNGCSITTKIDRPAYQTLGVLIKSEKVKIKMAKKTQEIKKVKFRNAYYFKMTEKEMQSFDEPTLTIQGDALTIEELVIRYRDGGMMDTKTRAGNYHEDPESVEGITQDFDLVDIQEQAEKVKELEEEVQLKIKEKEEEEKTKKEAEKETKKEAEKEVSKED